MDCPLCHKEMDKGHVNANSKEKVSLVTTWYCKECGYGTSEQHNIKK